MKKICFLIYSISDAGGTERVCTAIANKLSQSGYQITIISIFGSDPYFAVESEVTIIPVYQRKQHTKLQLVSLPLKLRHLFTTIRPDILINVDSALFLFSFIAGAGLALRNIVWEHFNYNMARQTTRSISRRLAAKYSSALVVLTQADKNNWQKSVLLTAPIVVIRNPAPSIKRKALDNRKNIVLAVGRLTPQKGFDKLLEAWSYLCEARHNDWELHIVGSGELHDNLRASISMKGLEKCVSMFPATPDIEKHYQNASVYCMSSRFEGFPMVLLEAQAHGLPIVSFDCQTGPSEIVVNGSGVLVPDGDTKGLAKALQHVVDKEEERAVMSQRAIENSANYSIDKIIGEWETLFHAQPDR